MKLARAGLDLNSLFAEASRLLQKAVPFDAACWHTLDPATLLETSHLTENLPVESPRAAEIEYLYEDYNQFATLARSRRRSGILSEATGGVPERSRRYRELIRPFGLKGELRIAFVARGAAWGAGGLLREAGDFMPEEASFLEAISEPMADAIRKALLFEAVAKEATEGPGVILLDEEQELEAMTSAAERQLSELIDISSNSKARPLPYVVYAVASRARLASRGLGPPAQARLRTRSGRWLLLHGSVLQGPPRSRTVVTVEEASGPALAPVIGQAYGLTARELQVMQLLLQGLSTKEIAALLYISPYTVQEHFKMIFEKVGVRSRRELVGKVFYQHYEPRARAGLRPHWSDRREGCD